jgi:hypothetical protein
MSPDVTSFIFPASAHLSNGKSVYSSLHSSFKMLATVQTIQHQMEGQLMNE